MAIIASKARIGIPRASGDVAILSAAHGAGTGIPHASGDVALSQLRRRQAKAVFPA